MHPITPLPPELRPIFLIVKQNFETLLVEQGNLFCICDQLDRLERRGMVTEQDSVAARKWISDQLGAVKPRPNPHWLMLDDLYASWGNYGGSEIRSQRRRDWLNFLIDDEVLL